MGHSTEASMQEQKRPSSGLERIAELAGVSRSTVSRVLNNDPNVKDSTRDRVLATVEEERFVPNRSARGLAMGRTGMIGIVITMGLMRKVRMRKHWSRSIHDNFLLVRQCTPRDVFELLYCRFLHCSNPNIPC